MADPKTARHSRTTRTPKKAITQAVDWAPRFLAALRETGVVAYACKAAGVGRTTVYQRRQDDPAFAAAWQVTLEDACDDLVVEARRRAVTGTRKPVFQGGKEVGAVQEFSDTLLIFLLKAHRPETYREVFTVKHDVVKELTAKANELGINVAADPILAELFAAAGAEGFGPAPNAATGGAAGGAGAAGEPEPAAGGLAE